MVESSHQRGIVMRRPKAVHQLTSAQFDAMFPVGDDDACKAYLVARRWPEGVACPRCGNAKVYKLASGFHWQCEVCAKDGYRFSCIAGTIFENTNKPLRDWFKITHLILTSKKGMSARQLGRYMGFGSVKTAWLMAHKIRAALMEPETKLGGIVEIDETFIGGKAHNKHADKRDGKPGGTASGKAIVVGAVRRKGNVVARVIENVSAATLDRFASEAVSNKVSLICTDQWTGYRNLKKTFPHAAIDHSRKEYVTGAVHTNTIEGFWSIFKRGVVGTFHNVSKKYLHLYVAEFQFRYNNRFNDDIFGDAIKGR
jgi:IS1 family transposase/ribosomal protein L37AE/L43A